MWNDRPFLDLPSEFRGSRGISTSQIGSQQRQKLSHIRDNHPHFTDVSMMRLSAHSAMKKGRPVSPETPPSHDRLYAD
jgi:hypothetical protein